MMISRAKWLILAAAVLTPEALASTDLCMAQFCQSVKYRDNNIYTHFYEGA
jgi:hypothetical protein